MIEENGIFKGGFLNEASFYMYLHPHIHLVYDFFHFLPSLVSFQRLVL